MHINSVQVEASCIPCPKPSILASTEHANQLRIEADKNDAASINSRGRQQRLPK
ncbi:hypothetical protein PAHAL_2G496300 [Panicum hallii]|uniref:Uncharacterized protein n=1 Tax=Panicum hallii TaxID=206008 RepID=A0A2T8KTG1_9POAL|nr:hypothetical protein PAHAL_2G496300 [Panicum hallii]